MGNAPNSSAMGRRSACRARAGEKRAAGFGGLAARRGAGYGERAEFVYDGAKVGVLSAQVKNAPPVLDGWRREGGGLWGAR